MAPGYLAGPVIDGIEKRAIVQSAAIDRPSKAHRTARIGIDEITEPQRISLVYIEETWSGEYDAGG